MATLTGRHRRTIYRYIREGRIEAWHLGGNGPWVIPHREVLRLLAYGPEEPPPKSGPRLTDMSKYDVMMVTAKAGPSRPSRWEAARWFS